MDENINLTILNEVNKGAKMGMDSITYVSDKLEQEDMKEELSAQYSGYGKILEKVNQLFEGYGEIPDDTPTMDKMMSWMGVQMNTMTDKTNSHIAQMLIQGNTMGIVEGQKLLNHNPDAEDKVKNIIDEFISFSQNNIEKMKEYL